MIEIQQYVNTKGISHFALPAATRSATTSATTKCSSNANAGDKPRDKPNNDNSTAAGSKILKYEEELYCILKNWYLSQKNGAITFKEFSPRNRYIRVFNREVCEGKFHLPLK